MTSAFDRIVAELQKSHEIYREECLLEFTEEVARRMKSLGLTRKSLAERLNWSKSRISKVLNGRPNLTIDTVAQIAFALDWKPKLSFRPIAEEPRGSQGREVWQSAPTGTGHRPAPGWDAEENLVSRQSLARAFEYRQKKMEKAIGTPVEAPPKDEAGANLAIAA